MLLAEQLVVDEFARGSNPEQTLASHVMRIEEHDEHGCFVESFAVSYVFQLLYFNFLW